jgi:hypothetical protein
VISLLKKLQRKLKLHQILHQNHHQEGINIMDRLKYLIVSILTVVFFILEYTWIPFEDIPIFYKVPFIYDGGPVRLDSWIYNASVKIEHFIVPLILYVLTPFKQECKLMGAFALSFIEFFFTWNEPIGKIPLPFEWWIPISTALLKLVSICWFMWVCIKEILYD